MSEAPAIPSTLVVSFIIIPQPNIPFPWDPLLSRGIPFKATCQEMPQNRQQKPETGPGRPLWQEAFASSARSCVKLPKQLSWVAGSWRGCGWGGIDPLDAAGKIQILKYLMDKKKKKTWNKKENYMPRVELNSALAFFTRGVLVQIHLVHLLYLVHPLHLSPYTSNQSRKLNNSCGTVNICGSH